jgi:hypothetical protein
VRAPLTIAISPVFNMIFLKESLDQHASEQIENTDADWLV